MRYVFKILICFVILLAWDKIFSERFKIDDFLRSKNFLELGLLYTQ